MISAIELAVNVLTHVELARYKYTLDKEKILIESILIVCGLNLMEGRRLDFRICPPLVTLHNGMNLIIKLFPLK